MSGRLLSLAPLALICPLSDDRDRTGVLERDEGLKFLRDTVPECDPAKLFAALDSDSDGRLCWQELTGLPNTWTRGACSNDVSFAATAEKICARRGRPEDQGLFRGMDHFLLQRILKRVCDEADASGPCTHCTLRLVNRYFFRLVEELADDHIIGVKHMVFDVSSYRGGAFVVPLAHFTPDVLERHEESRLGTHANAYASLWFWRKYAFDEGMAARTLRSARFDKVSVITNGPVENLRVHVKFAHHTVFHEDLEPVDGAIQTRNGGILHTADVRNFYALSKPFGKGEALNNELEFTLKYKHTALGKCTLNLCLLGAVADAFVGRRNISGGEVVRFVRGLDVTGCKVPAEFIGCSMELKVEGLTWELDN